MKIRKVNTLDISINNELLYYCKISNDNKFMILMFGYENLLRVIDLSNNNCLFEKKINSSCDSSFFCDQGNSIIYFADNKLEKYSLKYDKTNYILEKIFNIDYLDELEVTIDGNFLVYTARDKTIIIDLINYVVLKEFEYPLYVNSLSNSSKLCYLGDIIFNFETLSEIKIEVPIKYRLHNNTSAFINNDSTLALYTSYNDNGIEVDSTKHVIILVDTSTGNFQKELELSLFDYNSNYKIFLEPIKFETSCNGKFLYISFESTTSIYGLVVYDMKLLKQVYIYFLSGYQDNSYYMYEKDEKPYFYGNFFITSDDNKLIYWSQVSEEKTRIFFNDIIYEN